MYCLGTFSAQLLIIMSAYTLIKVYEHLWNQLLINMYDHMACVTKFSLYIPHDPKLSVNGIGNQGPKFLYSDRLVLGESIMGTCLMMGYIWIHPVHNRKEAVDYTGMCWLIWVLTITPMQPYFGISLNTGKYSVLQNLTAKHPIGTDPLKQYPINVNVDRTLFSYLESNNVDTTLF